VELRDAVVLVTGASRGIGAATAEELARRGATVVASGRDETALASVAARTQGSWVAADLRDPEAPQRVVEAALVAHGRLDAVVANAGVGWYGPFTAMPPDRLADVLDVDVRAPFLLVRAALPALLTRPPSRSGARRGVVLVSSIAGAVGVPGEAVYSAGKAAVEAFATVLREELRESGIRVSTVLPGVVDTDFFSVRGAAYDRRFPRPVPAARVARVVVDVLASGTPRRFEPRWLALPTWLSAAAPGPYRALARRFG
jgi:NAD(P)-dependent dehydrogenase (short-subunit alcohol dehydrogenase family)